MTDKITFKKGEKPTGLASIANPHAHVDIKINGKVCGSINPPNAFTKDEWKVGFKVNKKQPDDNPNCNWKWIFSIGFKDENEAREKTKDVYAAIIRKGYTVCTLDD